jgi:transposase-like protein
VFTAIYGVKYARAVECLIKDREAPLAFHDFPAEHWKYLRTTNAIESTFATVRHRFNDGSLWKLAIDCHQN